VVAQSVQFMPKKQGMASGIVAEEGGNAQSPGAADNITEDEVPF